jgi:hypothetical protein
MNFTFLLVNFTGAFGSKKDRSEVMELSWIRKRNVKSSVHSSVLSAFHRSFFQSTLSSCDSYNLTIVLLKLSPNMMIIKNMSGAISFCSYYVQFVYIKSNGKSRHK